MKYCVLYRITPEIQVWTFVKDPNAPDNSCGVMVWDNIPDAKRAAEAVGGKVCYWGCGELHLKEVEG